MQKYALSTQQHRRGSSYCSSPIRHCGAFMLPLINPAELFTVPQAAHHHKHPHAQQAAVTQLRNRCDFSQAPQEPAATAGSPACPARGSDGAAGSARRVAGRGHGEGHSSDWAHRPSALLSTFYKGMCLEPFSRLIWHRIWYFRNTLLFPNDHGKWCFFPYACQRM